MEANGREIVERIDNILKRKNLKRQSVCDFAGCTPTAIVHWKNQGSIPSADTAIKIAEFLGVSVQWLITGEDPEGLTDDERQLLEEWHAITSEGRKAVATLLSAYVKQAESEKNSNLAKG